jgi:hypothetical protein
MQKRINIFIGVCVVVLLAVAVFFVVVRQDDKKQEPQKVFKEHKESEIFPSDVLDLQNWKLTLPVIDTKTGSGPQDIKQPELADFNHVPWFSVTSDKSGVVFRAPVNASTTKNSDYPRSELREMEGNGRKEVFWSSSKGIHSMTIKEAITAVPENKPDVVAGQIHGDDDDLLTIRLEGQKLYVARSKKNINTLDDNYILGKQFTVKFIANDGKISIYYNGGENPVAIVEKKVKQAYFKVGVYTQSNCETEEKPNLCNENNYGEVIVYGLEVRHE